MAAGGILGARIPNGTPTLQMAGNIH